MSNVETVQAIYAAFGQGDLPAILDYLSDGVEWDVDGKSYGIPIYEGGVGKAHVERFFHALQTVDFLRSEPLNFLSGGDQVAVPIRIGMRVKKSGIEIQELEIQLWTFGADGKVSRLYHCIDRHPFIAAYGLTG
jgi:ketosteroid isomerase-like protein